MEFDVLEDARHVLHEEVAREANPSPDKNHAQTTGLSRLGKGPRKSKTEISTIAAFFDRPINDAAKSLGICPTVLKKICRKHGLKRWPNRRIRSIDKQLGILKGAIEDGFEHHKAAIEEQIELLQSEKDKLCFVA